MPLLLRAARAAYDDAIDDSLAEAGFDDLPRNGPFLLGGLAGGATSAVDLIRGLGVSRQAASQLIDTLVMRGYLRREINAADRRRMEIALTERGQAAAAIVSAAVERIDHQLAGLLTRSALDGLRAGLAALTRIESAGAAPRRQV
jgi:DNA-binding MarR family transcriptional regulator